MVKPLVKSINRQFSKQLLKFNDYSIIDIKGNLIKVEGFDRYNYLIDINSVFSTNPTFDPVDRTNQVKGPIRYSIERGWTIPRIEISLESALERRVCDLCARRQKINLLWSGGIDSTAIVVAFLQYAPDISQCRIIYSPWSTYEHPDFFKLLKTFDNLELLDMSGETYLNLNLDGVFVTGNTGDEIHASLDESFFSKYGYDFLFTSWKDLFYSKIPDDAFIDFCDEYFSRAGRDIKTVLDARWWFYASSKLTSLMNSTNLAFLTADSEIFDPNRLIGFFDCDVYEQFIYFNVDRLVYADGYATWRQFLKDFCYRFDGLDDWRVTKQKFSSDQIQVYTQKKVLLNNSRNLMLLADGHRVYTPNLPLFSRGDWDKIKQDYQYLFRRPNFSE